MVRLSKDAASPPAGEQIKTSLTGLAEAITRVLEPARRVAAGLAQAAQSLQERERLARWDEQYPVYRCPYVKHAYAEGLLDATRCTRSWDRETISATDLRMEVWDHITSTHMSGEAGLHWASRITSLIKEGP
jgi:hypothetical protein